MNEDLSYFTEKEIRYCKERKRREWRDFIISVILYCSVSGAFFYAGKHTWKAAFIIIIIGFLISIIWTLSLLIVSIYIDDISLFFSRLLRKKKKIRKSP